MKDASKIIISLISKFSYQILSMLVMFLLTPLMIKTLGDYKYGIWVLVNIIVAYYGYSELGVTSAIERNLAVAIGEKDNKKFNDVFINGLFLNFITLILIILITTISVVVVNDIKIKDYRLISYLIGIMGVNTGITFLFKSFSAVITANIRFEIVSGIMLFQLVLNALLTVYMMLNEHGLIGLSISLLISGISANILYAFWARKISSFIRFDFGLINKTTIKMLLKYSGKTFLSQIADILRWKVDEVVTGSFISIGMVTHYSIANRLNAAANSFGLSFLGVLTPYFSKKVNIIDDTEKANLFFSSSKIITTIASLVFFGFIFLGHPFINIWLGKNYLNAYPPLIILALAYFIAYIQSAGMTYMLSSNTHQYFAYISIAEGILNLIASLFFVAKLKLGITGVALGTLCGMFLSKICLQPLIVSKLLKLKLTDYYLFFIKNISIGSLLYLTAGFAMFKLKYSNYFEIAFTAFIFILVSMIHLILMLNSAEKKLIIDKAYSFIGDKELKKEI